MGRFCYRSKILPGKTAQVRRHWKEKNESAEGEELFWQALTMTGFASYLQSTQTGDFMIHCLEGESLHRIFQGLRDQIQKKNPIALNLQKFYLEVLGKDYALPESEPKVECLSTLQLPETAGVTKRRVFFYPLLQDKVEAHRLYRTNAMGKNRTKHEASMRAFGTFWHTVWLQKDESGYFLIQDSDRAQIEPTATARLALGAKAPLEWQEIAAILMDHTGLPYEALSPDVECLTAN